MNDQFDPPGGGQPEPKRDRYGRYLLPEPDSGKTIPWTRVTTFAKTLSDTFALTQWSERMVAKGMSLRPDLYALAASTDIDDRTTLNKITDQAKEAAASAAGANLGSALHAFTEQLDRGEKPTVPQPWTDDVTAYQNAMRAAGLTVMPDMIERIVVLPDMKVAGCFDRLLARHETTLVGDLKTAKRVDYSWCEIAIQLALYAHGAAIWEPATETYQAMPAVDQHRAIVMHLPVGQRRCQIYEVDIAAGWEAAHLALQVRTWRTRKDLATATPTGDALARIHRITAATDLRSQIAAAASIAQLVEIWHAADQAGTWNTTLTAAAKIRKSQLTQANERTRT